MLCICLHGPVLVDRSVPGLDGCKVANSNLSARDLNAGRQLTYNDGGDD